MTLAERLTPATRRWLALGAWIVATTLVIVAFRAIGWHRTVDALRRANVGWLVVAALANLSILALWAWQTLLFLPSECRASFGRMFEVTALTATATNTVPAFLGQATGVALLAERGDVGMAVSLSVLAQHQMVEGVAKVAMLLAAAQVAPLPSWMHDALVGLTVAVGALAIVLAVLSRTHVRPRGRLGAFLDHLARSLVALRSPRRLTLGLAIALLMKGAEALGWFAVERAFAVAPAPGSPFLALAAVNIASTLSASPGNLGVYEAAGYFVYTYLHVPREVAFALAVAGHLCYLVPLAGTGYVLLSWEFLRAQRLQSRAGERESRRA